MNQLENCRLARRLWVERVKPEQVTRYLSSWRCGTQACFGGHLVEWPEFQAMGVTAYEPTGEPQTAGAGSAVGDPYASEAAYVLFGDRTMFQPRDEDEFPGKSDYEVVLARLDWQIERLLTGGNGHA